MKLPNVGWVLVCASSLALGMGCGLEGDNDDDDQSDGSGPSTQGTEGPDDDDTQASATQNAETGTPTTDPTDDTAETGNPDDTGSPDDTGDPLPTTGSSESDAESDSSGEISPECNALCAHTPTALDAEADCVAATLQKLGGHTFTEPSCMEFTTAFDEGTATVAMCEQCYLDAGVAAPHCATAEEGCFFFP